MYYHVVYVDQGSKNRYGTGVYAENEADAKVVGAYYISLNNGISVTDKEVEVEELTEFESDVATTT